MRSAGSPVATRHSTRLSALVSRAARTKRSSSFALCARRLSRGRSALAAATNKGSLTKRTTSRPRPRAATTAAWRSARRDCSEKSTAHNTVLKPFQARRLTCLPRIPTGIASAVVHHARSEFDGAPRSGVECLDVWTSCGGIRRATARRSSHASRRDHVLGWRSSPLAQSAARVLLPYRSFGQPPTPFAPPGSWMASSTGGAHVNSAPTVAIPAAIVRAPSADPESHAPCQRDALALERVETGTLPCPTENRQPCANNSDDAVKTSPIVRRKSR